MRILLVGAGGREHALAWALRRSPRCEALFAAPGNPGIAACATCVDVRGDDVPAVVALAKRERVDLVVVGPEAPLVAGLVDALDAAGIAAFGPSSRAAALEGSKGFMKDLCARHGIPTAAYRRFTDCDAALAWVRAQGAPIVVKADGLAAGKGVTVAATRAEAEEAVTAALRDQRFGAGSVVIEAFLEGPELSFFALCDGLRAVPFATARDHKRLGDGDTGPNTGGMGAISPHPLATPALERGWIERFIAPTLAAMHADGAPFRGVLYAGLMLTADGPMLLEYNVRFGDPECQALMMRFDGDLAEVLHAAATGRLDEVTPAWRDEATACVVLAAPGYPDAPVAGDAIALDESALAERPWAQVFHAGTRRDVDGVLRASGGRVLNVVARGKDHDEARARAYDAVSCVRWPGAKYRHDIGAVRR